MTTAREDLELLLPFHANGTLSPAEAAEIDAWLAEDDEARAEAEGLARIRADLQAEDIRSPAEFGLARLLRDVTREQAAPAPQTTVISRPWLWQAVAAVALAAFVGQSFLGPQGTGSAPFELASGAEPAAGSGPALVVTFVPTATEAEIRALLLASELEIVAGPSSLGLYRLGGDDPAAALAVLRGAEIVESVENAND